MFTLVCCHFFKSQGGKIKKNNYQLFSWLKKEGKTEASACLIGWPVGPVSANHQPFEACIQKRQKSTLDRKNIVSEKNDKLFNPQRRAI